MRKIKINLIFKMQNSEQKSQLCNIYLRVIFTMIPEGGGKKSEKILDVFFFIKTKKLYITGTIEKKEIIPIIREVSLFNLELLESRKFAGYTARGIT